MSSLLLLGFARNVILRDARARTYVTGTDHANQLQRRADAVRERRPRRASVHLLQDSARLHVAKETRDKLEELGWDTVLRPPYSPEIVPSDYHLFRPLKAFLVKKKFTKAEDVDICIRMSHKF
ncbi:hypothetical protein Y032_0860g2735 [Ancylostoma ceylanicum]|uniref:Tc1-like transposase DDE domain-containing protein n=1 Tax=Ancylostoma ceylanicum TaxID=53326 RepID=A0A016WBS4_9BILA|nr:hypothetical protein Y032_0860g2735 [Ancylostoma ceylanicum]